MADCNITPAQHSPKTQEIPLWFCLKKIKLKFFSKADKVRHLRTVHLSSHHKWPHPVSTNTGNWGELGRIQMSCPVDLIPTALVPFFLWLQSGEGVRGCRENFRSFSHDRQHGFPCRFLQHVGSMPVCCIIYFPDPPMWFQTLAIFFDPGQFPERWLKYTSHSAPCPAHLYIECQKIYFKHILMLLRAVHNKQWHLANEWIHVHTYFVANMWD